MKRQFTEQKFHRDTREMISQANTIIESYVAQGYRMTLRQLYYQFVRNRLPSSPSEFSGLESLANSALASYRLDRWKGQENFVELWVEKAALAGVLEPLANEWHVVLMVNRGYSSASAMFSASHRFDSRKAKGIVLYLGDHDPSGEDMVRDIQERFTLFGSNVEVRKLALTMAQVEEYNPPPNPAKTTDSRFNGYQERHGDESWEVDALPPNVLGELIREAMQGIVDRDAMEKVLRQEKSDKTKFADALDEATKGKSKVSRKYLSVESPWQ